MELYTPFACFIIKLPGCIILEFLKKHANGVYKTHTDIGIIGDSPGSGKTLLALSLINSNKDFSQYKDVGIPTLCDRDRGCCKYNTVKLNEYIEDNKYIKSTLVVVPHGLFRQWKESI